MPYIEERRRLAVKPNVPSPAQGAGELNFQLTTLLNAYTAQNGLCYQTIADVLSSCDGAAREFYRRVAAPYEDSKIAANGDVYTIPTERTPTHA